jgi:ubiquinone/menaquinone biosynthesis C-methylase UbiE
MNERTFHPRDAHRLDDPERLRWLPPEDVLARLGPVSGMTVADVGAGTGYFALPLAGAVGAGGKVLAVDFQPEMLEKLKIRLSSKGAPRNVVPVGGEAARTNLPAGSCDLVFMSNLWHELDDRAGVLGEVQRLLRQGGRLAILDYRAELLPPPGPPASHRVSLDSLLEFLVGQGWSVRYAENVGEFSYLCNADPPARGQRSIAVSMP